MDPISQASWLPGLNVERQMRIADGLAAALAVSLPWSTSATSILAVLWLIAVIPLLDLKTLRREISTPAGGLPVLLWVLGVLGILWAVDVPFKDRLGGLSSFHKLLFIPLLMIQFRRSTRGAWVLIGYLASCSALLVASWADLLQPMLFRQSILTGRFPGVVVKDYIAQDMEFAVCAILFATLAMRAWLDRLRWRAGALLILAVTFMANVLYNGSSRTALLIVAALLLLFVWRIPGRNGRIWIVLGVLAAGAAAWPLTSQLRTNVANMWNEVQTFKPEAARTRAGERMIFWQKSIEFISTAPILGHGTGSIPDQFRRSAAGLTGMAGVATVNPHNQTFAVAIQLGLVGAAVLLAMWLTHLLMFRGPGLAAWVGLVVVTQNIIGSLVNSHLFDFTHGWSYVVGVGVAGGVVLANGRQGAETLQLRQPLPDAVRGDARRAEMAGD
jgi:O-antigen ligase